eukprot:TRINITY_DN853_c0_g1_i1.p2 TRINITY_DN853_c0_g1~~TRINITY_DN853_c0_g1_i1.p2  ORF type:complete len:171 (+),score=23.13 TRINITY_DN853_c0_g1_i1:604-1116(+)
MNLSDALSDTYLVGYACDNRKTYATIEKARDACCECGVECIGITLERDMASFTIRGGEIRGSYHQEVSWRRAESESTVDTCSWSDEIPDTFLRSYACGNSQKYDNMNSAQLACCDCQDCAGVTCDNELKGCTIRVGPTVEPSYTKENRLPCLPRMLQKIVLLDKQFKMHI